MHHGTNSNTDSNFEEEVSAEPVEFQPQETQESYKSNKK